VFLPREVLEKIKDNARKTISETIKLQDIPRFRIEDEFEA